VRCLPIAWTSKKLAKRAAKNYTDVHYFCVFFVPREIAEKWRRRAAKERGEVVVLRTVTASLVSSGSVRSPGM
jgi:hypothetical protein